MDYLSVLKSGNVRLIKQFAETGRHNIEILFKGIPVSPEYVQDAKNIARWEIKYQKNMDHVLGYFLPIGQMEAGIALLRDGETWMSLTPLELESHMLPLNAAKGHVVVAGLGLGMISINLLRKQSVKRLTVLEYDADLIKDFELLLSSPSKEEWQEALASGRLQLIQCDCKKALSQQIKQKIGRVDYLWVDIWSGLGTKEALIDTKHLCKQLKPKLCDYWGMELEIVSQMREQGLKPEKKFVYKGIEALGIKTSALKFNRAQRDAFSDFVMMAAMHVVIATR